MADIIIDIDGETGDITSEGIGYRGGKCKLDMDELNKLLGLRVTSERQKPEFARVVPVQRIKR